MNTQEIKEFYKIYAKRMRVRVLGLSVASFIIRAVYSVIPTRYSNELPNMIEKLRPMAVPGAVVMNFKIGDKAPATWLYQITTLVHEVAHVFRIRKYVKEGGTVLGWYEMYYKNSKFRAIEEGIACAAEAQIIYFLHGTRNSFPQMEKYFVGNDGVRICDLTFHQHLDVACERGPGAATIKAASAAIRLLREMGFKGA